MNEIIIGGRDLAAAEKVAIEVGKKATAVRVDGSDEKSLSTAIHGSDLVVNTAGPVHIVALPALRTVIHEKVHYIDLCADACF